MPEVIKKDDGSEVTLYSQEELDAQIATKEAEKAAALKEKDDHVKAKLDEFNKGKSGFELKDKERDEQIAAAKATADAATQAIADERARRHATVQGFALDQIAGTDPDMRKKIEDALPLVNLEVKEDKDILERVRLASVIAGIGNSSSGSPLNMPFMGGMSPAPAPKDAVSDADHNTFLKETGLGK